MFCKNCGQKVSEQDSFCISCGAKIDWQTKESSDTVVEEVKKKSPVLWLVLILIAIAAAVVTIIFLLKGLSKEEPVDVKSPVGQEVQEDVPEWKEEELHDIVPSDDGTVAEEETEIKEADIIDVPVVSEPVQGAVYVVDPFYGIWTMSTKDETEANMYVEELRAAGYDAFVIHTNDWSNLNNGWYSVSAGSFISEEDAVYNLPYVKDYCEDAYVKYSGEYVGGTYDIVNQTKKMICISEMYNGEIFYFDCYTVGDAFYPKDEYCKLNYRDDVKITILDPNQDYSPYADVVSTSEKHFIEMVKGAVEWNNYGFVCQVTIQDGEIIAIEELYLP